MNAWISTLPADKVERWIAANGERAMEQHDTDDAYFALWLHYLNRAVMRRVLIGYRDLEDWDYWSAYDGDMNPVEAAELMLEHNGFESIKARYFERMNDPDYDPYYDESEY